ncbi:MAG: sulfatase-like hydrolase/transferase [Prolixibacteraceae bacterium]
MKYYYKLQVLSIALLAALTFDAFSQTRENRPNIIFMLTDDQRDNTLGAMGHPILQTPAMDKLMQQGVRFSNTYIATPVCAPSRISLFTGMPERIHGVGFSSSYQITEEQWSKTYPAILRENGYYTGFVGKFGVEYYTFRGNADEKFDFWIGHDGWTKFFPKEYNNFSCDPYHGFDNDIITPIMGEALNQFLESTPSDKPFCLSVSFNVPHGSQTTSMYDGYEGWHDMLRPANENPKLTGHPVYDDLYRNTNIPLPEETAEDPYRFIPQFILDQDSGRKNQTYSYDYTRETCREHYIRYYQTITGLDKIIGEFISELENRGLMDNTIIIFASDHGLLMGEYGMGGKALLYDLSSKIPCFVYDPSLPEKKRGKTVDKLVSSLDIPATILKYAGVEKPEEMTGSSLIPLIHGAETEWREELFLESLFTLRDNPFCEGIRKGDWKYIRMYDGVVPFDESHLDFAGKKPAFEQLFNLKDDPGEKNNLIKEYENSELLKEFREKVSNYSVEINQKRSDYMKSHAVLTRE